MENMRKIVKYRMKKNGDTIFEKVGSCFIIYINIVFEKEILE